MARKSKPRDVKPAPSADADADTAFEQAHALLAEEAEADYPAALALFRRAAERGHAQAQNDLATLLSDGLGCATDMPSAIRWYELSAAQGDAAAQYNLGLVYLHGVGVDADKGLAAEYLLQASAAGDAAAMSALGTMLSQGDGVERDIVVAAWLHLGATEDGDQAAVDAIGGYWRELVGPALERNVHAARALYRVYRDGLGQQADPASAWAWIRWAHDVCLPRTEQPAEEERELVGDEFARALQSIGTAERDAGERWLRALLEQQRHAVQPAWQPILLCETEGASVALLGRWGARYGWEFRHAPPDATATRGDATDPGDEARAVAGWDDALLLLERHAWHRFRCLHVHPEFRAAVWKVWDARCEKDRDDDGRFAGSWQEQLRQMRD